ncbi:ATP synthase subunit C lysine N-methyltransferase-like [Babylonia areolata]|uniref:ATP synthase subunit C lysine N-methyltransferase-like n=1 Tax=Babylonia areolata TaxID=304850 RepID=UPI003FD40EEB
MAAVNDIKSEPEKCDFCEEINRASAACPPDPNKPKVTKAGAVILGVAGTFFVGIYAATAPFLMPALRRICLPFVPATTAQVRNVFTALAGRSGSLIDIGSGDGRITLEAARQGFKAYGVELNTWLVLYSRVTAWRQGLHQTASFMKQDLWKTNLSSYDNIVIFGVEQMMQQFEEKLSEELPTSSRVVACRFPLPSWEPIATVGTGVDTVWLYKVSKPNL